MDFMGSILSAMKNNEFDYTKDGKCSCCGACCSNLLPVSEKEIREIKKYIKKKHIEPCRHLTPFSAATAATGDLLCPFLDTGKEKEKCRIYEVRPLICRDFSCHYEKNRRNMAVKDLQQIRRCVDVRRTFFGGEE